MRYDVPDPAWKRDPDIVADLTFGERFLPDDENEFDEEEYPNAEG